MLPSPPDREPPLDALLRAEDFERVMAPFVDPALCGAAGPHAVLLFDRRGGRHAGVWRDGCVAQSWEQCPPEVQAQRPGAGPFVVAGLQCLLRPCYAGADRVGQLLFARPVRPGSAPSAADDEAWPALAGALSGVVGQLLQAGFAAWVTSELHLAASESSYLAMQARNAELERAVSQLKELDQLKSNFLATVSHELRTPLTSVIGFSEMLIEGLAGALNPEQRDYVQTILDRGEELLRLITQLLEMSRMEVGAVELDLAPARVHDLVERALEGVALLAERAGVQLHDETAGQPLPSVLVDRDKVGQILVNLLGNAIKFTPEGGHVRVRAAPAPIRRPFEAETMFGEEAQDAVCVSVQDTGKGIPADKLERVFEAFYQVDSSSTRVHGGAGLGLSIVRNLVTAHGGDVWVESAPGQGTTVHFTLPLSRAEAADAIP